MFEMAIYIIRPIAALVVFVVLAYLVLFGPFRHIFAARLIQRQDQSKKRIFLLHDLGLTLLNLLIVVTLTTFITQWLFCIWHEYNRQ